MDILGITSVAEITILAYLIGLVVKFTSIDNKWIPVICGVAGCALGVIALSIMPSYPADNYITAAAVGVVSGLAATGADQIYKQLK